ncbi:lantibiotic dehydratase [Archangium violaceum]|uniref:lantibiotic dehydratase n=1 Tax=Archangium violaceum TaxID=83451 RepID=UPI00193BF392|nr:lantibiotic dehydratase [Archangium violaceum]QRK08637.1 lantibiotic dehydratase [Archangium violaceum]
MTTAPKPNSTPPPMPHHLRSLGYGWSVWKDFLLRGAGFPVKYILQLGSPELARSVDRMLELERELREAIATADRLCEQQQHQLHGPRWKLLTRVRKALRTGHYAKLAEWDGPGAEELERVRRAAEVLEAHRLQTGQALEWENLRLGTELRHLSRQERFGEAVLWQNRTAYHTGVRHLLETPVGDRSSSARSKERFVANYAQRYCTKNDSIGFFGPTAWGEFLEEGAPLTCRPGPDLLGARRTFLEYWAVDALCAVLSALPDMRPWMAPRRMPLVRLEGSTLYTPLGTDELEPLEARVFAACDGERTAASIARSLLEEPPPGPRTEQDVYEVLEGLASRRLIFWALEVPTSGRSTFTGILRAQLERIEDAPLREHALSMLGELEAARESVARAAGDVGALDVALGQVEETFSRLTGAASSRKGGQLYAGRTLIYEDCRRDMEISVGPQLRERLGPTLALLLQGSRWVTYHMSLAYADVFMRLYEEARSEAGSDTVEMTHYWVRMAEQIPKAGGSFPETVQAVLTEFQRRWSALFGLPSDARRIELSSQALLPRIAETFGAPGPGWPTARQHSPDIMIAARSVEDIARNDYRFVIGELHMGMNTIDQELFSDDHDQPSLLGEWMGHDLQRGRVTPTIPKAIASSRASYGLTWHPEDACVEFEEARSFRSRYRTFAIADLVIQRLDGRLQVRTRDGRERWDLIAFLDALLSSPRISMLPAASHTPRITVDGVVVWRESWQFTPEDMAFAHRESALERFAGARELALAHGLPRFMFVKASAEKKPCYLDLCSPLYVENLAHLVRRSTSITLSEMIPAPDECWLSDARGDTYTCELRIVAVDPEPWSPRRVPESQTPTARPE